MINSYRVPSTTAHSLASFRSLESKARLTKASKYGFLGVLAWGLCSSSASASLLFTLSTDVPNPTQIAIGQTLHVQLSVTGILSSDEFVALSGRVTVDPTKFDVLQIVVGPIIPNPLDDPLDLVTITGAGSADATFLTLGDSFTDRVTSSGLFFTVELEAIGTGVAPVEIAFLDALQIDPTDVQNLLTPQLDAGPSLTLQVIPEPSGSALALLGFLALIAVNLRKAVARSMARAWFLHLVRH